MDDLTRYLKQQVSLGQKPTEAGFAEFKVRGREERTTHPGAQHAKYFDATGAPYTIGGMTEKDKYDEAQQRRANEERQKANMRPVPRAYGLQQDTAEHRAASAAHAQQMAAAVRRSEQES